MEQAPIISCLQDSTDPAEIATFPWMTFGGSRDKGETEE
jgi:hypothetical protein